MRIYGVPLTGSVFVEAASPEDALALANQWAEIVLMNSVSDEAEPVGEEIGFVILKPNDSNIKDATDEVKAMFKQAEGE